MELWSDEFITLRAAEVGVEASKSVSHCPSESESLEHLAGYEVSQDPAKGAYQHEADPDFLCEVCHHHHNEDSPHLD